MTILRGGGAAVEIAGAAPFVLIGERINPTGRPRLTEEITAGVMDTVRADALAQVAAGARVLDVNAGVPGFDEAAMLAQVVRAVTEVVEVPLCVDSSTPEVLEAVLPLVPGKPLVNSVTAERTSLERILPLVARHRAAVIGMANDETGISMDPAARLSAARAILEAALDAGIPPEDVVIDPLCLPIGADDHAARVFLETIRLVRSELGVELSCGASNISFGLPDRQAIEATFLPMAIAAGMHAAIANPLLEPVRRAVAATDVLLGRDPYASAWIAAHRAKLAAART